MEGMHGVFQRAENIDDLDEQEAAGRCCPHPRVTIPESGSQIYKSTLYRLSTRIQIFLMTGTFNNTTYCLSTRSKGLFARTL